MYADNLLLISSTCSDRMLWKVFSKPMVYNTITFNTAVFLDTGIPRFPSQQLDEQLAGQLRAPLLSAIGYSLLLL